MRGVDVLEVEGGNGSGGDAGVGDSGGSGGPALPATGGGLGLLLAGAAGLVGAAYMVRRRQGT